MGRNRSFEEHAVLTRCAQAFLRTGYEGTSIDDLVRATGLHRGSLYKAFGSKRGLFLKALRQLLSSGTLSLPALDLLLVATLELAPRDTEVHGLVAASLGRFGEQDAATVLGNRLLQRARLDTVSTSRRPAKEIH